MAKNQRPKIVAVVGPTASGKSDMGIFLAKKISTRGGLSSGWQGAEIISADSRQVYRRLDIGTGKVPRDGNSKLKILNSKQAQNSKFKIQNNTYFSSGIRHHLIDVVSPKKQFTADNFKKLGEKALKEILAKNKVPIIVGGTGFYIDVLLGRMSVAEVPPNKKLRARFDKLTVEHLFKMLKKLDPRRAKTIDPKNKRRLIRALEIVLTTGKPVPGPAVSNKYQVLWIGLKPKNLETRIKKRLDARLEQGMVKEVKTLLKSGVSKRRLYNFGLEYRWLTRYLNKEVGYKEMKEGLLRDIIKYSKRQMTWFKRNKEVRWIRDLPAQAGQKEAGKIIQKFLASHP